MTEKTKQNRLEINSIANYLFSYIKQKTPDPIKELEGPPKRVQLPRALLKTIGAHTYRCQDCDPQYSEKLMGMAKIKATKDYEANLEEKTKAKLFRSLMQQN